MPESAVSSGVHIAIVGGGLGGLAFAIGLQKTNISFHIYEAAAKFSEIGAGVVFGTNAIRALGSIHPELLAAYRKHATPNPPGAWLTYRRGMRKRQETSISVALDSTEIGETFWKQYDHAESGYVHRARLLDEMVKLIPPGTASFKKRLNRIEEIPTGGLTLVFEDGTQVFADAIVGCDGIKSCTRSYVCGNDVQPRYSGQYAYRQLFPMDLAVSTLGQERAKSMTLECGYGGYIIHYPIEGGTLMNMTAVCNDNNSDWEQGEWLVPVSKESMLEDWKEWDPQLRALMSQIQHPERRALFDLRHDQPYARGRVCLLGDSAHATTPHNGAGAAMAMEDAYLLSGLLSGVVCPEDLGSALSGYDCVRRPRTQRLIEISRQTGRIKSFTNDAVSDDTEKFEQTLGAFYRWIWQVDLCEELERARKVTRSAKI